MNIPNANWREAFKNLYAALPSDKNAGVDLPVIVNRNATRLLHLKAGAGLFYSKCLHLFRCFLHRENQGSLTERFIVNAHIAFRKEIPEIYKSMMLLLNALKSLGAGLPAGVEIAIPRLEAQLSHWNADTYPFLKKIHKNLPPSLEKFLLRGFLPRRPLFLKAKSSFLTLLRPLRKLLDWVRKQLANPFLFVFRKWSPKDITLTRELSIRSENQAFFEEDRARAVFPFGCARLFKLMETFHSYMEIRQRINRSIPFEPLFRLIEGKQLTETQEQAIKNFIKACDGLKPALSPSHLHSFLKLIQNLIPTENRKYKLTELELKFIEYGCSLFYQKDPKQLRWRTRLEHGLKLSLVNSEGDSDIQLGKELSKNRADNKWRVFDVEGRPNEVLIAGYNLQIIAIEEQISRNYTYYFPRPRLLYFDPQGRFALLEKLSERVCDHKWNIESGKISLEDKQYLTPVVNFIKRAFADQLTPQKLDRKKLYYDQNYALKFLDISLAGDFDFCALERLCQLGPPEVAAHLMKEAPFHTYEHTPKHNLSKYFYATLENTLKNPDFNFRDEAAQNDIADDRIIKQSKKLIKQSQKIKKRAYRSIKEHYKPKAEEKKKILEAINAQIVKIHKSLYGVGYIWKGMTETVVNAVLKQFKINTAASIQKK